jgi:hypothetical protein
LFFSSFVLADYVINAQRREKCRLSRSLWGQ